MIMCMIMNFDAIFLLVYLFIFRIMHTQYDKKSIKNLMKKEDF